MTIVKYLRYYIKTYQIVNLFLHLFYTSYQRRYRWEEFNKSLSQISNHICMINLKLFSHSSHSTASDPSPYFLSRSPFSLSLSSFSRALSLSVLSLATSQVSATSLSLALSKITLYLFVFSLPSPPLINLSLSISLCPLYLFSSPFQKPLSFCRSLHLHSQKSHLSMSLSSLVLLETPIKNVLCLRSKP